MISETKQAVITERHGHILVVTLNRPEAKNACNAAVAQGVSAAMDVLDAEDALFVGVITDAGGNFSAGADLKADSDCFAGRLANP